MRRWQKTFLVTTIIFAFLTVDVWCGPCRAPSVRARETRRRALLLLLRADPQVFLQPQP